MKLEFSPGKNNRKIRKLIGSLRVPASKVWTLSLLAGWSCPFARDCKSRVEVQGRRRKVRDLGEFRCYSASQEATYSSVYNQRSNNFEKLRNCGSSIRKADLILRSLPKSAKIIRIHVSGDFFSQDYFDAWLIVAKLKKSIIFYAYTKSLPFWIRRRSVIPKNLRLTASYGGKSDKLIPIYGLRSATVVDGFEQARKLNLPIDTNDLHAFGTENKSFALLLHGTQPKGSVANTRRYKDEHCLANVENFNLSIGVMSNG